eukprot:gene14327-30500_t
MEKKSTDTWKFPADAETHYKELLLQTERYRHIRHHEAAGYHGPWIENHFINHFINKPLSYFNGFIPIFVQWVDLHVYEIDLENNQKRNTSIPEYKTYHTDISKLLRTDVLYITVSQDDQGIHKLSHLNPNILVLSAGGYGHIPIPLLKEYLEYIPRKTDDPFVWEVGFYGNIRPRLSRSRMLAEMRGALDSAHIKYTFMQSTDWKQNIANTKFNLVPRGFGRTSYRLAEVVNIGRIPVYLYDDVPWIPYAGTNVSVEAFGLIGQMGNMVGLVSQLVSVSRSELDVVHRLEMVRQANEYYTYEGVLKQIELFLSDPLGPKGGYLRCSPVPDKDKRR